MYHKNHPKYYVKSLLLLSILTKYYHYHIQKNLSMYDLIRLVLTCTSSVFLFLLHRESGGFLRKVERESRGPPLFE